MILESSLLVGRYQRQVHALARACSRMGARARVWLSPGGREAGRARCQGGLPPERRLFLGAGFLEAMAGSLLSLAKNYKLTLPISPQSRRARRDFTTEV